MGRINERLKSIRDGARLSQQEMADIAEVTVGSYQRWEYGTVIPKAEGALKLATHFGFSLDWLYRGENQLTNSTPTGVDKRIINLLAKLNQDNREKAYLELIGLAADQMKEMADRTIRGYSKYNDTERIDVRPSVVNEKIEEIRRKIKERDERRMLKKVGILPDKM